MNSNQLNSELNSLERKISLLLNEYKNLKKELDHTKTENEELRSVLSSKEHQISDFQNKFKISKIADSLALSGDDSTELKQVLNEYIKEIDRCIAHLSQ
jgi:chromosome segregation ATPase|tara:strand:- start:1176 stop:1472 length:297 start_codon:yes stop_codon:yes gene_type:complete